MGLGGSLSGACPAGSRSEGVGGGMVSMSTQLLFGLLLLLLLFGWCDVCVVVCVCFPSSKYRYKAMVNAKVEYMYMTQLKASVLSSGAMTIWLWSLVANYSNYLLWGGGGSFPEGLRLELQRIFSF